ncbi:MAG: hypothetical protein MHM6MM_003764 [Cercozoa sp. M6MM]
MQFPLSEDAVTALLATESASMVRQMGQAELQLCCEKEAPNHSAARQILTLYLAALLLEEDYTEALQVGKRWKQRGAAMKLKIDTALALANVADAMRSHRYAEAMQVLPTPRESSGVKCVERLRRVLRQRIAASLSLACTHVKSSDMAAMLGLTVEELAEAAGSLGWRLQGDVATPLPKEPESGHIGEQTLQSLTSLVCTLERS